MENVYSADYPLAIIGKWRIQILSVNYNNAKWTNVRTLHRRAFTSFALRMENITSLLSYLKFQAYRLKFFNHWMFAAGLKRIFLDAISFQKLCRFSLHDRKKCDRENPTKGKQINKSFIHYRHFNGRIQLARLPIASARLFESVLNVLLSPNLVLHKAKICMEPTSHVKSNYFLH